MKYAYCVDLGGTAIKMGLFREDGQLLDKWQLGTDRSGGGQNIPSDIAGSVLAHMGGRGLAREECLGVGVGVPGQVRPDGTVYAENLRWEGFPLVSRLASATGLRVAAENDANAAAIGEHWQGGGKGYGSLVLVTLGTGVGGGVILDGRCLQGAHLAGGEIGHIQVNPEETRRCACGGKGCLEQYASATGCVRMALDALGASDAPSALRGRPELEARDVWDAAKAGDGLALGVARQFCRYLARGLAAVASIVDPEAFVIGGGVSGAGQALIDMTVEYYKESVMSFFRETPIVLARLGNDAGLYGCAAMLL